jgi:hypothetical protein
MLFGETVAVYCENNTEHIPWVGSPYLTGNTLLLGCRAQPVIAVLRKQSLFIVTTVRNTEIHSVGRMQSVPHGKHVTSPLQSPIG